MKPVPTSEDRIWAVIAHLSAIAFGMGILLPIIGWSEQRRKSNYTSFQCLQALGYQSLGYTVWALFSAVAVIIFVIIMLPTLNAARGSNEVGNLMNIFIAFIFGLSGIYVLLPIIAAISCALGKDFHYPIMGKRLAQYLGYDSTSNSEERTWLIEGHEERWVAAMGNFSILIMLWGMLAPLTALLLQGKHSLFLKFQSIQTLVYQGITTVLYFGAGFVYVFGIFLVAAIMGLMENTQAGSSEMIPGFIIFIIASFIAIAILLLIPLLHVVGQYAGYRVLKGDNYHYPVIGGLVEKSLLRSSLRSETRVELT